MLSILTNIWPTTVEGWILLVGAVVGLIGALAKLIPTMIKLGKATAELAKNKDFATLKKIAIAAMSQAQASGKSGAEKLQMVIAAIRAGAAEVHIEVSDADIDKLIDAVTELKQFFKDMKAADDLAKHKEGE